MRITKSSGERTAFDPKKLHQTIRRAGASERLADRVLKRVTPKIKDGMSSKRLLTIVRREISRENRHLAQRYGLREALLKLGPAGFKFEKYVASILNAYHYAATLPEKELVGLCVRHEVDVIATKDKLCIMIEVKFRNRFGDRVDLQDTMAAWARFTDLKESQKTNGSCPEFDEAWLVTNGRFSDRAQQFGQCRNIKLVGWSTGDSLARMVDHAALYPITVIDGLRQWELDRFAKRDLMLCQEVANEDPDRLSGQLGLPRRRVREIASQCQAVVNLN